jgi:anaerobic selenocysteine-containing dehydrogenase
MGKKLSRRDFLKISGLSTAAGAVLTGCGTAARRVERRTYEEMPEYTLPGKSTFFASTCQECSAGCGIIVRTAEGRAKKIEGNVNHPVNKGRTCSRGQAVLQGLYNPDRYEHPVMQTKRGSGDFKEISWDDGINVVADALKDTRPEEIVFLLGLSPDHLSDLAQDLTDAIGAPEPLRFDGLTMFEGRTTMADATNDLFGVSTFPYFDIANTDVIFSFGANFTETWISPVSYSFGYGEMRQGRPGRRGYLVQFEARMSQTGANADEWFPVVPGSEGLIAKALGSLITGLKGEAEVPFFSGVDLKNVSDASGVSEDDLLRLARIFVEAERPIAIPGGLSIGQTNGLENAKAILSLNTLGGSLGKPGGVSLSPVDPLSLEPGNRSSSFNQFEELITQMRSGKVKVLFVHNTNPLFSLPAASGIEDALKNVPLVVSFASYMDETSIQADYVLPDHTSLESWGYQRIITGSDVEVLSGVQPVVSQLYKTHATADVLLAAVRDIGGSLASALPYQDEVEYIQKKVVGLNTKDGSYVAPDEHTFWTFWLQSGGWWKSEPDLQVPSVEAEFLQSEKHSAEAEFSGSLHNYEFKLVVYPSLYLGDGRGANRSWLQETPDPMTTGMWDSWVEVNPKTAHHLGLQNDDIVKIISPVGEIEALVYVYPAIRPDVVAVPLGQGHTAFGRFADGVGFNPLNLLDTKQNEAGDLAFCATRVKIQPTGKRKQLARKEHVEGVYGDNH